MPKSRMAYKPNAQITKRLVVFVIFILTLLALAPNIQADDRDMYIADDWMDYLRLVPVSTHDGYHPIVFCDQSRILLPMMILPELHGGTQISCSSDIIDTLNSRLWPKTETIVVATDDMQFGIYAAAIASALDAPMYFDLIPEKQARTRGVARVIMVGSELVPDAQTVIRLLSIEDTRRYYESLIDNRDMAVLADTSEQSFIAAAVAGYHHCPILQNPEEIKDYRPRSLAWVTAPEAVTKERVKKLYHSCRFSPDTQTYDVAVGIITGLDPRDMSLVLVKTYAYPKLAGDWKMHAISAATNETQRDTVWHVRDYAIQALHGQSLTVSRFTEELTEAGYAYLCAHGSPGGLGLRDGSWPPDDLTFMPPLVFVAEACLTGDITALGVEKSVALKVISAGAVAYIGSMEIGGVALIGDYPFMQSTPDLPLGEEVRLQNSGRLDADADWPRVILIGEPTFHRMDHDLYTAEDIDDSQLRAVQISGRGETVPANIAVDLPNDLEVAYAVADLPNGKTQEYCRWIGFGGNVMTVAAKYDRQRVLLQWPGGDGQIRLYDKKPLGVAIIGFLSVALSGVSVLLSDLISLATVPGWFLVILGLFIMLGQQFRDTPIASARKWIALITGFGMGGLTIIAMGLNQSSLLSIILVTIGAITVAMLVPSEQVRIWHTFKAMAIYALPMFIVWAVINGIDISSKTLVMIGYGMCVIVICYGIVLLLAGWLYRFVARRMGGRSA